MQITDHSVDNLNKEVFDIDVILFSTAEISREVIEVSKKLKVIPHSGIGVDNDKIREIISKKEVTMMKDSVYLINCACACGPVVNERELIKALDEGLIARAG